MQISMKPLKIGNFTASLPIIQGGMGIGVSLFGLASAVANEGGVGVISAAGVGKLPFAISNKLSNTEALKEQIRKARELTKGILGVNIMVALSDYAALVKTAVEEGIDIIFAGAGLALNLPEFLKKESKTKLIPIVSSGKAAGLIMRWWKEKYNYLPDGFVVEGPLAGGHLGFSKEQISDPKYCLENLVTDVINKTNNETTETGEKIPVIAAGGIFSGADVHRFLKLGAAGVQMATRFVGTDECDASLEYKKAYVACKKEDIGIVDSPVGLPGRAIYNRFMNKVRSGITKPKHCPFSCITPCKREESPYCITEALLRAYHGRTEDGLMFVGANGYKVNEIVPVHKLVETIKSEYSNAVCQEQNNEIHPERMQAE